MTIVECTQDNCRYNQDKICQKHKIVLSTEGEYDSQVHEHCIYFEEVEEG